MFTSLFLPVAVSATNQSLLAPHCAPHTSLSSVQGLNTPHCDKNPPLDPDERSHYAEGCQSQLRLALRLICTGTNARTQKHRWLLVLYMPAWAGTRLGNTAALTANACKCKEGLRTTNVWVKHLNLHNHAVSDKQARIHTHVRTIYGKLKYKYKAFLLVEVRGASIRAA